MTDSEFSHCLVMLGIRIHFNPDPKRFHTNVSKAEFDILLNTHGSI
jgi:hypothetical protein